MPTHEDGHGDPRLRETVQEMVVRATEDIRTDVKNLERIMESLKEKNADNGYEVRRFKEIVEDIKKNNDELARNVQKITANFSDLPLIRRLVYGVVIIMLTSVIASFLTHSGLPFKPL